MSWLRSHFQAAVWPGSDTTCPQRCAYLSSTKRSSRACTASFSVQPELRASRLRACLVGRLRKCCTCDERGAPASQLPRHRPCTCPGRPCPAVDPALQRWPRYGSCYEGSSWPKRLPASPRAAQRLVHSLTLSSHAHSWTRTDTQPRQAPAHYRHLWHM